jgi:hemoglobin
MGRKTEEGIIERARIAEGSALTDRRDLLLRGAILSAAAVATPFATAGCSRAAEQPARADEQSGTSAGESLYDRLGGIFAIAGVVNYVSDEIIKDPTAGARSRNPALRKWHTESLDRLPGLKFMRTLWVANVAGGPYQYTPTRPGSTNLGLEEAHKDLKITSGEFDAVAAVLSRSLDHFEVPEKEKSEVLAAFAAHKGEVTRGSQGAQ